MTLHCERDKEPEIRVTEEMIEAGALELAYYNPLEDSPEATVHAIFEAMYRESRFMGDKGRADRRD
jgi:hypothetical protein